MSSKNSLWWLGLLIILGSYFYLYESRGKGKESEETERLPLLPEGDIEWLRLTKGDKVLICEKRQNGWEVIRPSLSLKNYDAIDSIISSLEFAQVVEVISKDPNNLADYGLNKPTIEIEIKMSGTGSLKVQTLLMGDDNPSETCTYAKWEDASTIILTGVLLKKELEINISRIFREHLTGQ